jgi:stage V sporulation protein AD
MPQRIGTDTLFLPTRPGVLGHAAVAGKKEAAGPLAAYFDQTFTDSRIGMKTWEQAEAKMQTEAVRLAFAKAGVKPEEAQAVFAGDLLNQCISSTFGLRELGVPFIGQYGACSTIAQSAAVAVRVTCPAPKAGSVATLTSNTANNRANNRFISSTPIRPV